MAFWGIGNIGVPTHTTKPDKNMQNRNPIPGNNLPSRPIPVLNKPQSTIKLPPINTFGRPNKPQSTIKLPPINTFGRPNGPQGRPGIPTVTDNGGNNNWNNNWNNGGDWGGGYVAPQPPQPDPAELLRQLLEARKAEAARQRAEREAQARKINDALMGEGKAMEGRYQAQFGSIANDYQDLKNQSEVNRYKAQRAMRETQANRGLLDSGAGRQDNLFLNSNYNNNLNKIMIKEAQERQRVQDAINSMWAKIGTEKTRNLASAITEAPNFSTFDSLMPLLASGYDGNTSGLLKAALGVAKTASVPTPNVKNYSNTTTGRALTDDDDYFSPKKIR